MTAVPKLIDFLFPTCLWRKKGMEKVLFLTFDDGPIPLLTPWVLAELDKYKAKATFFCVGQNVKLNPEIFESILAKGHHVGNHTFSHKSAFKCSHFEYLNDVQLCDNVHSRIGESPYFRPPYGLLKWGDYHQLKIKKTIVMWSVLSKDYDQKIKKEDCLKNTIAATEPGSIVLFHDSLKAEKNLRYVLPRFLEYFASRGYRFEVL